MSLSGRVALAVKNAVAPIDYVTPDPQRVLGMDCSHWAGGLIDFARAKRNGLQFVFVKAKNSIYTVDWFLENWQAAREAGIHRGAYAWLYPSSVMSANRQARELYALLSGQSGELPGADFGELPVVVDYEWTSYNGKAANPTLSDLYGFVTTWEALSGAKPIIYTAPGYWAQYGSREPRWAEYLLWLANYDTETPTVPLPWVEYTFWQWTERGYGLDFGLDPLQKRAVDLDYFIGDAVDFEQYFGKTIDPPEPIDLPEPLPDPVYTGVVVSADGVNVRSAPVVASSTKVGAKAKGDPVEGLRVEDGADNDYRWLELTNGNYVAIGPRNGSQVYVRLNEPLPDLPLADEGPLLFRVRHDPTSPRWGYAPRKTGGLSEPPEVNPCFANRSFTSGTQRTPMVAHGWEAYLRWLNGDNFDQAVDPNRAMFNGPESMDEPFSDRDRMESLWPGGAAVTGELVNGWLQCWTMEWEAGPPLPWPSYWDDPLRVHHMCRINAKTGAILPGFSKRPAIYFPNVCKYPVYFPEAWLEPFPELPRVVEIKAPLGVVERAEPMQASERLKAWAQGSLVTITGYRLHGAEVWGHVAGGGWIALYWPNGWLWKYLTSWHMETAPV